jgi:hypothetical protein
MKDFDARSVWLMTVAEPEARYQALGMIDGYLTENPMSSIID